MSNFKKYGWIGVLFVIGFVVIAGLVPARETEEIKELQITQADIELLSRIRQCRPADLSDAMDAVGLIGTGSMSPEMRPIRPGIKFAGFAYTVKYVPTKKDVKECKTTEEYHKELGAWGSRVYAFTKGLRKADNIVCVVDMQGMPVGLWGSLIGMEMMHKGLEGVVLDGTCRDSYECNIEGVKAFCTKRSYNHPYGRIELDGVNVPVKCADVKVNPMDIIVADDDGVLVIPYKKAGLVVQIAEDILKRDQRNRANWYKTLGLSPDDTLGEFK
jgi:regulator of RNase E activity RraA